MATVEVVEGHEHEPIRVVDDLETDEYGRPARWLWHVECYRCGAVLDDEQARGPAAVAR